MLLSRYSTLGLFALVAQISAQSDDENNAGERQGVTCWGVNGQGYPNNTRCAGSGTCCGPEAQCMPNRLCKNPGQEENMFVRGPCAFDPYDDQRCGAICVYDENDDGSAFFFPRVEVCQDGSFCCSNIANCCERGRGTFLDTKGNIIDGPSTETSSEQSSAPTLPPTLASSGGQSIPTNAEANGGGGNGDGAGSGGDTNTLAIGLGVAIPVVAILGALGVWLYIRRRRNANRGLQGDPGHPEGKKEVPWTPPTPPKEAPASELDSAPNNVYEMDGSTQQMHTRPQELSGR